MCTFIKINSLMRTFSEMTSLVHTFSEVNSLVCTFSEVNSLVYTVHTFSNYVTLSAPSASRHGRQGKARTHLRTHSRARTHAHTHTTYTHTHTHTQSIRVMFLCSQNMQQYLRHIEADSCQGMLRKQQHSVKQL